MIGEVKVEWVKTHLIIIGMLLLLNIHPSGVASLVFLLNWSKPRKALSIRRLIRVCSVYLMTLVLLFRSRNSIHLTDLVSTWRFSQRNVLFDIESSEIATRVIETLWGLLTLESSAPIFNFVVGILGWYVFFVSLLARNLDMAKGVFAVAILALSYLSGIPNSLGQLAGLPTLLFYSTPQRFIHVPILLMFILALNRCSLRAKTDRRLNHLDIYQIKCFGRFPILSALLGVMWVLSMLRVWITLPPR